MKLKNPHYNSQLLTELQNINYKFAFFSIKKVSVSMGNNYWSQKPIIKYFPVGIQLNKQNTRLVISAQNYFWNVFITKYIVFIRKS